MRIGELSKKSGFSIDTIRYYDKIGILQPVRRGPSSRFREYTEEALDLLRLVRAAKVARLTLPDIRKILHAAEEGTACKEVISLLDRKVKEIDEAIRSLEELRTRLAEVLKKGFARVEAGRVCPILLGLAKEQNNAEKKRN